MTWTDASADPKANGANCYNCHQIDKKEISYGTIGPSLWNYGKLRGVKDVRPGQRRHRAIHLGARCGTKAYARLLEHAALRPMKLLNEEQLRHPMALLLDPKSPVNQ